MLELAHAKLHAQTTSIRTTTNEKARGDHVIARNYQRKKAGKRTNWLRSILKLQNGSPLTAWNLKLQESEVL